MSAIRISVGHLVGLLTDLLHTAAPDPAKAQSPVLASVLLHTERGHWGAEPGRRDLLVGSSTDGQVGGHSFVLCTGQWHGGPGLLSVADSRAVLAVLKTLLAPPGEQEHDVELSRDQLSQTLTIAGDPDLFGDTTSLTVRFATAEDYPVRALFYGLAFRPGPEPVRTGSGVVESALPLTEWFGARLTPFVKVAGRRGVALGMYRWHQRRPVLFTAGEHYRGFALPYPYDTEATGDAGHYPPVDLYPPPLDLTDPDPVPPGDEPTDGQATDDQATDDQATDGEAAT